MARTPTSLYRLYNAEGVLLYVGIAADPGRRMTQHSRQKRWWDEVVGTTLEHFGHREDAIAAEREAIQTEHPLYNVQHSVIGPPNGDASGVSGLTPDHLVRLGIDFRAFSIHEIVMEGAVASWPEEAAALVRDGYRAAMAY